MSTPAGGLAAEEALIQQIHRIIARINEKTTELQNSINSKIGWLPEFLADKVREGWNSFIGFLRECWDALVEVFTNAGSPFTLSNTADSWSDSVGGPVSGQVQAAEAGSLEVDDHWDGDAADQYRQNLPMQKAALEKIKTVYTDGISTALSDVAKGIVQFWGGLLLALLALVGGIVGAILSSATIFGLPAAPFIAATAAATAVGAFYGGGLVLKSAVASANSTLRQKLNDNTAYRDPDGGNDGHWPPATTR